MAKDPKPVTFVSSTKAEVPSEPVRVTRITAEIEATRFSIVCWDGDKKVAERVARHFKKTEHGTTIEYSDASSIPDIEDVAFEVDLEDLLTFDLDTACFDLARALDDGDDALEESDVDEVAEAGDKGGEDV